MNSRREFVKSVGVASLGSTFGIGSAKKGKGGERNDRNSRGHGRTDTNLQKRVDKAFHKGGSESVRHLLDGADVGYDMSTSTLADVEETTDGGDSEYTIQEGFSQSDSEISVATWVSTHQDGPISRPDDDDDIVTFHVAQILENIKGTIGSAKYVDDVIGATWKGDNWELVGEPSIEATAPHVGYFYSGSYRDEGVLAKIDLQTNNWSGYIEDKKCVVTLSGTVEYVGDNVTPIMGYYEHLEGLYDWEYIESIELDAGRVSIEISDKSRSLWEMADFSNPSETTYL